MGSGTSSSPLARLLSILSSPGDTFPLTVPSCREVPGLSDRPASSAEVPPPSCFGSRGRRALGRGLPQVHTTFSPSLGPPLWAELRLLATGPSGQQDPPLLQRESESKEGRVMTLAGCWKGEQGRSLGAETKARREGGTLGGEEAQTPCERGREGGSWCPRREQVTQGRL